MNTENEVQEVAELENKSGDVTSVNTESENESTEFNFEQFFDANQDRVKKALADLLGRHSEVDELDNKLKELDEKEKTLNIRQLEQDTMKLLMERDIPVNVMKLIIGSDLDATVQNIEIFQQEFDKAVQEQVIKRIAGKTPQGGSYSGSGNSKLNETTKNAIKGIIRR